MGKGDWMPFGVQGIVAVLATLFPHLMTFVAYGWLMVVIVGLGRTLYRRGLTWRKAGMLFVVFNIPTAMTLVIAHFR